MNTTYRAGRSLKPFRRPWLWTTLWMLAIGGVVALSLLPPKDLPDLPIGNDKVSHFLAYFALMAGAVQLFARRASWWLVALLLVLFGIAMEQLQGGMKLGRQLDTLDVLANALGVLAGLATAITPLRDLLLRIDGGRG